MRILIVGAGPAGLTLAAALLARNIKPTVIEKAPVARTGGYAVGLHLNGWNVAERLGILDTLRANNMPLGEATYRDHTGRRLFSYNYEHIVDALGGKMIAIMRDVLQQELLKAVAPRCPIRFDTTVVRLVETSAGIETSFNDGTTEPFDLVVGADGIHSRVRELTFGPEEQFVRPLGYWAAAWRMQTTTPLSGTFVGHMSVDRQGALYRVSDTETATLFCWRDSSGDYARAERQAKLQREFGSWTAEVAQAVRTPIDWSSAFFDRVAQVVMPQWSSGRVVLIGDAAHSHSFFSGQGTSMAMAGAYILAEELARAPVAQAAAAYERRMRPSVLRLQEASKTVGGQFVPKSQFGLWMQSHLAGILLSKPLVPLFARRLSAPNLLDTAA